MSQDISSNITADNSQFLASLEEAKGAAQSFFQSITDQTAGLGGALEDIQSKFSAAFAFTGLAAATAGLAKVSEIINSMGSEAIQISTLSNVLGVTVEQFQALRLAGEEAGAGPEVLARGSERLAQTLDEARAGSQQAIDKMLALGVSIEQIQSPTFQLNDLLQLLHDRLTNASTAQAEHDALLQIYGSRSALMIAALEHYVGSTQGVASANERVNALTGEQNTALVDLKRRWDELSDSLSNTFKKAVLGAIDGFNSLQGAASTAQLSKATLGGAVGTNPFAQMGAQMSQVTAQIDADFRKTFDDITRQNDDAARKMLQDQMESAHASAQAFQEGSAERVQYLKEYADLAQRYYGSDTIAVVKQAYAEFGAAQRAYNSEQARMNTELYEGWDSLYTQITQRHGQMLEEQLRQSQQAAKEEQRVEQELTDFGESLDKEVLSLKDKNVQEQKALNDRMAQDFKSTYGGIFNTLESGFTGAISGMLQGTETFSQIARNLFDSLITSVIGMFVKMGVNWAENLAMQHYLTTQHALQTISANAGIAGSAGVASWAGAPWPVDAGAPAFGAAAAADAMSYASFSAAGGFDIPAGLNPVTQLHAGEMVLPQGLADVVRTAASSSGSDGGGGQQMNVTIQLQAWDGQSVQSWLQSGGAAQISRAVSRYHNVPQPRR
ncbi:MAG TPA: hypothetical protein VFB37_07180 [Steroidobacteraceae bacterium]|nr:hypothetical protein [Steroidobacteraceae bacterium]